MKKLLCLALCLLFPVLSLFGCGGVARIESEEWVLASVSLYGEIVYASPDLIESAEGATALECTLKAKGGTLTITDATNDRVYTGVYGERGEPGPTTADHKVTFGTESGRALIAHTTPTEGEALLTLTLTVDDYVLSFIAK